MKAKWLWLSLVPLTLASTALAQKLSPSDVFSRASPSVVVVKVYSKLDKLLGFGSGVAVSGGVVVTNCHVLRPKGAQYAEVEYRSKNLSADLRHVDLERDLCSLSVKGLSAPSALIGDSKTTQIGAKVYAIGAPEGYQLTLSDGLVSGKRMLGGNQFIQVTAPISHGSSGGGLFDDLGRLVGITTLMDTSGQALNFAIPAEWIAELPERNTFHDDAVGNATAADAAATAAELAADASAALAADDRNSPAPVESGATSRWQLLIKDSNKSIFIDQKSIRTSGSTVTAWIRHIPVFASWVVDGKEIRYHDEYLHASFYCDSREMLISESYITDDRGVQLGWRGQVDRFAVSPTSGYDPLIDAVCSL